MTAERQAAEDAAELAMRPMTEIQREQFRRLRYAWNSLPIDAAAHEIVAFATRLAWRKKWS